MRKNRLAVIGMAGIVVAAAVSAEPLPEGIESEIEHRIADKKLVGMVIGMVDADGIHYHKFGEPKADSGAPPDEYTVFEIGSITVVFTAILLGATPLPVPAASLPGATLRAASD